MSESMDRLNEVLRDLGYDVRGDVVVVRPIRNETLEVRRSEHALVIGISTDIGPEFRCDGIRIERFRKNPVVFWVHDYDGLRIARSLWERTRSGDSEDDARMLIVKPQFHLDTELSREVWALVQNDAEVKWELGVIPAEWHNEGPVITTWDLVEISAVPSKECAQRIRQRIKDRTISSPAMLRSVKCADAPAELEPTLIGSRFMRLVGPYSWRCRGTSLAQPWCVFGPGLDIVLNTKAEAMTRVAELNDAWLRGHDYAAEDKPSPPRLDASPDVPMDGIKERIAELERWRRGVDQNFAAARRVWNES